MSYNLNARVEREIIAFAKKYGVRKVILFGSLKAIRDVKAIYLSLFQNLKREIDESWV